MIEESEKTLQERERIKLIKLYMIQESEKPYRTVKEKLSRGGATIGCASIKQNFSIGYYSNIYFNNGSK